MTMEDKKVFIDTNILVYSVNELSDFHSTARRVLTQLMCEGFVFFISQQVLREYLVYLTRSLYTQSYRDRQYVIENVRMLQRDFAILPDTPKVLEQLIELYEAIPIGGKQIHDANIVATMLVHDVKHLLTHNVQDFERFADLITILPLESE